MPMRVATHPQRSEAQARSERIPEIVGARGQHRERSGCQTHADESEDHDDIDDQDEAESFVWRQDSPRDTSSASSTWLNQVGGHGLLGHDAEYQASRPADFGAEGARTPLRPLSEAKRACEEPGLTLSLRTVDVAQRLAAAVVATLVATIAATELCVTRAVGAARAARWPLGSSFRPLRGLSGACGASVGCGWR